MHSLATLLSFDEGAVPFWQRLISLFGLFAMVAIAWLFSKHRQRVPWRVVAWGIGLQVSFGVLVMKTDIGLRLFSVLNDLVLALLGFTAEGTEFIFGDFASEKFTIAINVLPTLIFFSSLMTILYHLGIMQRLVGIFAWIMRRTMKTSGPETLSVAANTFVGQTEAPLMIAPFIGRMTMSELTAVMTGGFATVAGGVLAAYVGLLKGVFPDIAGHLIAATVMSAPAALVIAKVM
ncbi:MAG: NupC/NupG family nucleoside CNT transporter, partial [Myxococcales bacterium]|nr:NupC/NupG family nucleoside CNT transporter [Myxococcales bacterium]